MLEFYKIPSSGGGRWIDRVARMRSEERGDGGVRKRGRTGQREDHVSQRGMFGSGVVADSVINSRHPFEHWYSPLPVPRSASGTQWAQIHVYRIDSTPRS